MKKIKSGVYGLNSIMDGGINANSTTVVIGCSGAGKTTFATQFIRRGLEEGQEGVFVSLDENKEQIIKEAIEMGWTDILEHVKNKSLVFIDASGKDFSTFIKKELPSFVKRWEGADARIAIDPLTPVVWSLRDRYEQRDVIGFMLKELRKIGTVVATLEEHGKGDLSGPEVVIPMYLADNVIHLNYRATEDSKRYMKIVKARSTRHSDRYHNYVIVGGLGVVVDTEPYKPAKSRKAAQEIAKRLAAQRSKIPKSAYEKIRASLKNMCDDDLKGIDKEDIVRLILEEYGE
jgi:circadian clock protein KaiC